MALYDNITNLFKLKQANHTTVQSASLSHSEDSKLQTETYVYYGTRICGKVTASLPALSAFLPKVYNAEKQRQVEDEAIQLKHRQQLTKDLEITESDIATIKAEKIKAETRIDNLNDSIAMLHEKLVEAKSHHGEINKMAKVKLDIGLGILCILTVYLFVFYSSTFYSAFFRQFDVDITIGAAMFDSQAIPNAFSDGFGELIFIICAPIIFMGLGYGLHFFMQQSVWTKYLKSATILSITFIFDCILAYLVAKKIYDIESLTRIGDIPPFSPAIAISDINVWAVIFCGFIVYIIWGIVFDMVMTAYEELRSNQSEIIKIETNIQDKKELFSQEKLKYSDLEADLEKMQKRKQAITREMSETIHYDVQIIKSALADFFSGWMTMMNGLNRPKEEQDEANNIYNITIKQLFN